MAQLQEAAMILYPYTDAHREKERGNLCMSFAYSVIIKNLITLLFKNEG